MGDYERVILVKQEVFVYRVQPLQSSDRGHRAADWKLDEPDWTGRLRVVVKDKACELRLEDKGSGQLFAKCPIDKYPGVAIEAVTDSSRYFVIRLQDDTGRNAFIGMGFADRGDSFDLNVALQDHFKQEKKDEEIEKQELEEANQPKLDLAFKEGETITISIGNKGGERSRPRPAAGANAGPVPLLPPPPTAGTTTPRSRGIPPPPAN